MPKIQIRKNVFETNSSSTHSICISKKPVQINTNNPVGFYLGEYGWGNGTYRATDYLYTAIMCFDDRNELLEKLKTILDKHNIKYTFQPAELSHGEYNGKKFTWLDNGGIDHYDETRMLIDAVLNDEDMLLRLIFGESVVYTGNDNDDDNPERKNIAEDQIYDHKKHKMIKNPYKDSDNYDYFFKGN